MALSEGEPISLVTNAPRWKGKKFGTGSSHAFGTEVLKVFDQTERYPSFYVKTVPKEELKGLSNECEILTVLADSGITPKPLMLKTTQSEDDVPVGFLAMTEIAGQSLDQNPQLLPTAKQRFDELAASITEAFSKIASYGVYNGDINPGSFLLNGLTDEKEPLSTNIVDFQYATHKGKLNTLRNPTKTFGGDWNDLGLWIFANREDFTWDEKTMIRHQQYELAVALLWTVGIDLVEAIDTVNFTMLSIADKERYIKQSHVLKESLLKLLTDRERQLYPGAVRAGIHFGASEEEYGRVIASMHFAQSLKELNANTFVPLLLEAHGVKASPACITFLQSALSPFLDERPEEPFRLNA